ncbi:MAG: hypothetical protein ACE5K1_09455 [Acidiferrobacterales bacterium]
MARTQTLRLLIVTLIAYLPVGVLATDVRNAQFSREDGGYIIRFELTVAMDPVKARKVLTDYSQWPDLIDALQASHVIEYFPNGGQRVLLTFRPCVMMFCKTIKQVKDVTNSASGAISTVIIPLETDFEWGWERMRIVPEPGGIRLVYHAQFIPAFAAPPIPSWVLKRELRQVLTTARERMERLDTQ